MDMVRLSLQGFRTRGVGNRVVTAMRDSIEPGLQEKPGGGSCERPYRRPTRVAGCESTKVDG